MTMLPLSEASRILEHHAHSSQPWDRRTVPIERGFFEDRVVRAFVEPHLEPITLDLYDASGPHEPLVGLLWFDLLVTRQPSRQPAVAAMCNHRQRHIKVHIEADFAGQAVEVEEIHANSQSVFDSVPLGGDKR